MIAWVQYLLIAAVLYLIWILLLKQWIILRIYARKYPGKILSYYYPVTGIYTHLQLHII
jgi:hypothetical protein